MARKSGRAKSNKQISTSESLEIPEFSGLGPAQHSVADDCKFRDQIVGIRAAQSGGVNFSRKQDHRRNICAAFQAILLKSSRQIEDFSVMTANTATST
jgi:hypothetical protein